jgi:hypothetical protein
MREIKNRDWKLLSSITCPIARQLRLNHQNKVCSRYVKKICKREDKGKYKECGGRK